MKYQQIQPPAQLKNYVRYFWVSEDDERFDVPYSFTTVPDGGPGLIFQNPDKGRYEQGGLLLSPLFLYGLSTIPATIQLTGSFSTVGVHFYPHALKSVFGMDADELTDGCMDVEEVANRHGFFLTERLAQVTAVQQKVEILSEYLSFLVCRHSVHDHSTMTHVLEQIVSLKGSISVKSLQDQLYLSERSIERKFKQYVGMSPRLYMRICRFQASLMQLGNKNYKTLSDLAYENDYADQSHLIRSFKEFSGISPSQYTQKTGTIISVDVPLVGAVQFYR